MSLTRAVLLSVIASFASLAATPSADAQVWKLQGGKKPAAKKPAKKPAKKARAKAARGNKARPAARAGAGEKVVVVEDTSRWGE